VDETKPRVSNIGDILVTEISGLGTKVCDKRGDSSCILLGEGAPASSRAASGSTTGSTGSSSEGFLLRDSGFEALNE